MSWTTVFTYMNFGEHVTIDGYGGDPQKLDTKETVEECLEELCALLKMHPLGDGKATVLSAPDNNLKDPGGWSGFLIIAESHISIHTFPKRKFVSADVYTCQNGLDIDLIVNYFRDKFSLDSIEQHFLKRGTQYPEQNLL